MLTPHDYRVISSAVKVSCTKYTAPDWIEADDIVQTVAEKYLRLRLRGKVIRDLMGWSVRVSEYKLVDLFRATTTVVRNMAQLDAYEWCRRVDAAPVDPEQLAMANDMLDKIAAAFPRETAIVCSPLSWSGVSYSDRYQARRRLKSHLRRGVFASFDFERTLPVSIPPSAPSTPKLTDEPTE